MGEPSLLETLEQSIRRSLAERRLWLYGCIIAFPSAIFVTVLEHAQLKDAELLSRIMQHPLWFFLFLSCQFLCMLVGKSALLLSLPKSSPARTSLRVSIFRPAFLKALGIDLTVLGLLLGIVLFLSLPTLFSFAVRGSSSETLLMLAQITLLPILLIGAFVREFTYCYRLLSPLTLQSSFEAGINLLLRHKRQCFHFGLLFFGMTFLLFTFLLNLVMLSIVTVGHFFSAVVTSGLLFAIMLFIIMWFEVLKQTLWFEFFQALARPKNPEPQTQPTQILKEEVEISGT